VNPLNLLPLSPRCAPAPGMSGIGGAIDDLSALTWSLTFSSLASIFERSALEVSWFLQTWVRPCSLAPSNLLGKQGDY
jgi:hypothetical protein